MSMHRETQGMRGRLLIEARDRRGTLVRRVAERNHIVSGGKVLVANLFRGQEKKAVSHVALGSGAKAVSSVDSALEAEVGPRRAFDSTEIEDGTCASALFRSEDGQPALRVFAAEAGVRGNELKVRLAREGRKLSAAVEAPGEREELSDFRLEEASSLASRLVRFEPRAKEAPAPAGPVQLSGGRDVSVLLSATFGYDDCNGRVCEAGLFNASEGGVMYNRVVFPEMRKTPSLSLTIAWRISF
jgi:hypothetical protein